MPHTLCRLMCDHLRMTEVLCHCYVNLRITTSLSWKYKSKLIKLRQLIRFFLCIVDIASFSSESCLLISLIIDGFCCVYIINLERIRVLVNKSIESFFGQNKWSNSNYNLSNFKKRKTFQTLFTATEEKMRSIFQSWIIKFGPSKLILWYLYLINQ